MTNNFMCFFNVKGPVTFEKELCLGRNRIQTNFLRYSSADMKRDVFVL